MTLPLVPFVLCCYSDLHTPSVRRDLSLPLFDFVYSSLSFLGGAIQTFEASLNISSMMMTGNEIKTTAFHSAQFKGVIMKRVCRLRETGQWRAKGTKQRRGSTHGEERNVEDHEVKSHREGDRSDKVHVLPGRKREERLVLCERVQSLTRFHRQSAHRLTVHNFLRGARLTLNISITTRTDSETVVARFASSFENMSHPI